ncbi:MAG: alginate lyase family protein [Anaerolineales bacterium]|nr:alginate lyase family protein [Anaerolineales bacterium]
MGKMLARARLGWALGQQMGAGWLAYRLWYAASLKSGLVARRLPMSSWGERPFTATLADPQLAEPNAYTAYRQQAATPFYFTAPDRAVYSSLLGQWDGEEATPGRLVEELRSGQWRYYGQPCGDGNKPAVIGMPPNWHRNPFTGQTAPKEQHWSRISDFAHGDIKTIWEASRFSFVYALVRAYWRSGDEALAELFWQLVLDWREQNPPQQGPNWKCGQETSLRIMGWCFGLYGFSGSVTSTPERVATLAHMLAISGERVEGNLRYALSQQNNHGISEATGLWTLGLLFPEFQAAARWREKGRKALEAQGQTLIYDDGSFAQHSVNYQRLMLHDYLWCMRLGELHGRPFSTALQQRIQAAGNWLYQLQAGHNGEVPYYGQIDGALILPLNNCDFQDFRPVIQATHYLTKGTRCYPDGPWDEDLLWLFGPQALGTAVISVRQDDFVAPDGGYYTLRTAKSMVFTRCAKLHHRPSQADMLHVDLWQQGNPIAVDAGTYSYNAPPPWNNVLAHTRYHNTVTVDDQEQMERMGKFMWLPWVEGKVQYSQRSDDGRLAYWQGTHGGYGRLPQPVKYQRAIVQAGEDTWLILDAGQSIGAHQYRLHWLLYPWAYTWQPEQGHVQLNTPGGVYHMRLGQIGAEAALSLVTGAKDSPRGWYAPYYGRREPALSLTVEGEGKTAVFWTLFTPVDTKVAALGNSVHFHGQDGRVTVEWSLTAASNLVRRVYVEGEFTRRLDITA